MSKTKEPPKPIFPLKHEFYESMDNFIHVAGMLGDTVRQALDMGVIEKRAAEILKTRLAAFDAARGH